MKYCMDCLDFHGNITDEERQLLVRLLQRYEARTMMESWVKLGKAKVRGRGRTKEDPDKLKIREILRRSRSFCMKQRVCVYALEPGCGFYTEKE